MSTRNMVSRVVVETHAPDAKEVFLAGTFNGWEARRQAMKRTKEGLWRATFELPAGTYEYKFVVDGRWCCNPVGDEPPEAAGSCVRNEFGTMNRILVIAAPDAESRRLEQGS